ncbi:FtsW/RodA/SpoVE family cell cycle protein [Prevotella sp. kh1p2]|uniref:FtsW/RodA/SpoVE family cell cycle protein n=1 Tax=Prevotella sp. kh1p2 TaxID=1761883 RepID=UPI0008AC9F4A|nr:FtsW/RodA/SpoVE family cell cycle protein [Prevotella sp. kh1p2]SES82754.1 cell division protein FtsW [Prevotella sp. kh1p2]SNU10850.1 cell division protein FtsW [Prevotellaceae bacterium KH2P17]
MINKTLGNIFKGDKVIWMVFFFLCIISVVEVFSASSSLSYKGGNYWSPVLKHCSILLVGVFSMVVVLNVKCKYFKILTPFLLIISFLTLIWVLIAGQSTNGAQRWINFVGIQFQPSEIAKGTMVLAVAQILSAMQTENGADRNAFKYILITCAAIIPWILLENFSTAALLCLVILMMMIIGRVPFSQIGRLLGVVMLLGVFALVMIMAIGGEEQKPNANRQLTEQVVVEREKPGALEKVFHRASTWKSRILSFMDDKNIPPDSVDLDKDGQVAHANIAIASSNIVGKGPGNSVERDFLSQAFSDFIYAIIIEETGVEGAFFVAMLYIILLFRTGRIANRCENNFPAFLAMGLALLLVTQALFNMCVAVGLAPVTGQPLPLVSKGGTSTIINCIYVGVILSVSRSAAKKQDLPEQETGSGALAPA